MPCGLKASLFDFIGQLKIIYKGNNSEVILNRQDLVDRSYLEAAKSNSPEEDPQPTRGDFLSWYLPQIPGFGTRMLAAKADSGLKGEYIVEFD